MKQLLTLFALFLGLGITNAQINTYTPQETRFIQAEALYHKKEYKESLKLYHELANEGFDYAMVALANVYAEGKAVAKDSDMALKWYQKADAKGNGYAAYFMAAMYAYGNGVDKNTDTAKVYFEKSANQRNLLAILAYGFEILDHKDVSQMSKFEKRIELNMILSWISQLMGEKVIFKDINSDNTEHTQYTNMEWDMENPFSSEVKFNKKYVNNSKQENSTTTFYIKDVTEFQGMKKDGGMIGMLFAHGKSDAFKTVQKETGQTYEFWNTQFTFSPQVSYIQMAYAWEYAIKLSGGKLYSELSD